MELEADRCVFEAAEYLDCSNGRRLTAGLRRRDRVVHVELGDRSRDVPLVLGRPREEERAFAGVLRQRGGALELRAGFGEAAELEQ